MTQTEIHEVEHVLNLAQCEIRAMYNRLNILSSNVLIEVEQLLEKYQRLLNNIPEGKPRRSAKSFVGELTYRSSKDLKDDGKCFIYNQDEIVRKMAEYASQGIELPSKWVSVKDRLPDEEGHYLADTCAWSGVCEVRYFNGHWRDIEVRETIDDFVTYWTPLPPPPETSNPK
jgi:hypothetical protein